MGANIKQYRQAFDISQNFIDAIKINKYPIDMFAVLSRNQEARILVSSFKDYKEWLKITGKTCSDSIKDAKCYYDPSNNVYIIVYNEKKPKNRIRFSLAHELGHIILKHLDDERTEIERGGLDDITYYMMEGAANTFAGNFLAPPILIHERLAGRRFNISDISQYFLMSYEAVRDYRKQDYRHWLEFSHSESEYRILDKCKNKLFPHFCDNCSYTSYGKDVKYCPICGASINSNYGSEDSTTMQYPKIELNEKGRTKECPCCGNNEHVEDAFFCMICGKPAVNQCTFAINGYSSSEQCEHDEPLPGNARYCPYCGNKTTFLEQSLLMPWDNPEINSEFDSEDDSDVPF